jgi:CheY-like chemotaxis protein/HPt (histidine-containing phosphotransfer) domain-containing protein
LLEVVVIDDAKLIGMLIKKFVSEQQMYCTHYTSPVPFLERKPEEVEHTGLVFLDILMPSMNGLAALKRMRQIKHLAKIPVVVFSAAAHENNVAKAISAGADGFLAKPPNKQRLLDELHRLAKLKDGSLLAQNLCDEVPEYENIEHRPDLDLGPADLNFMLDFLEGDEPVMREMLAAFCEQTPSLMDKMGECLQQKDFDGLYRKTHYLKNAVNNFAAEYIRDWVHELEQSAQMEEKVLCEEAYKHLTRDMRNLHKTLEKWLAK